MGLKPYYEQGGIVIYCGDCREVLPVLPAESVDVLTDPPYLVNHTGRWDGTHEAIKGDGSAEWLEPSFREVHRLMKPDTLCVSFYGWPQADLFLGIWKALGFRPVSHLAFVKRVWGLGRFTRSQHETAYLLAKGHPSFPGAAVSDTVEWEREREAFHPNQKPVAALLPLLTSYTAEGQVVLDPFMGSGSTLRAAKESACRAIGVEIEERYCELAARRMEQGVLFGASVTRKTGAFEPSLFE
jgi:DNA modification methylase